MIRIKDYDLSSHNTFGMKVRCALYIEYGSQAELQSIDWDSLPQPVLHIGGGSNLLFTGDFPGTVLHSAIRFREYSFGENGEVLCHAGAGENFDSLSEDACSRGLWGLENLSLIPGEVGAAAVQNIGAYGVEAKDVIREVHCLERDTLSPVTLRCEDCGYGYRDSRFKREKGRFIVTSVVFVLAREYSPRLDYGNIRSSLEGEDLDKLTPSIVRSAVVSIRRKKLPDPSEKGSAGSFFKNPVVPMDKYLSIKDAEGVEPPHFILPGDMVKIPAAWMIDRCGLKGEKEGGAMVYPTQPLVIVNDTGKATPEDVIALENKVIGTVKERFGITLHPEVEHV